LLSNIDNFIQYSYQNLEKILKYNDFLGDFKLKSPKGGKVQKNYKYKVPITDKIKNKIAPRSIFLCLYLTGMAISN
tara:strand:+ start:226 stop:453 length:228 start_codon:yes stop_codon:yes gene_type:complete